MHVHSNIPLEELVTKGYKLILLFQLCFVQIK